MRKPEIFYLKLDSETCALLLQRYWIHLLKTGIYIIAMFWSL